ncbi:hypothetical protein KC343_g12451 [Hortaea werneckii]|nr:hypothetical protein KC352_g22779 [Hortaea werneckii]KAI7555939.1 hypothetical protein KC317_g12604 [Hortaea werneckii]KAI7602082.1 hypothetical protein KC346_g12524 [Hortaea werneckii]KAI7609097.1 hypothetical protein KC343_g12451 [Hortaea werneckii]KAI7645125.1 hypothetical protein KC319_g12118 [Hortaea werneckii]
MATEGRSAFFYGTLMAPQVLHRVCHGSSSPDNPIYAAHKLQTHPAILHDHRRHRVRSADYPAVLPVPGSTVRGTYVTGLTDGDIWRLDIFEGSEYRRDKVTVHLLKEVGDASGTGNVEGDAVEAETYIWISDPSDLEEGEWDFRQFQEQKMRFWVGAEGAGEYAGRASIIEVDEAVQQQRQDGTGGRGFNGHITSALEEAQKGGQAGKNSS